MLTWNQIYNEKELYRAAVKIYTKPLFNYRKGLISGIDDQTLFGFAQNTSKNLERLHKKLQSRSFHYQPALQRVFNLNGKIREMYISPWDDKIVDTILYTRINEALTSLWSKHSYAYRYRDAGVDFCQSKVKQSVRALIGRPFFVLRRDIKSYFPSIDQAILLGKLKQYIKEDDYLFHLLEERIRCKYRYDDSGTELCLKKGVPFGTAAACLMANINLMEMDKAIEQLGCDYFRYADDFLLVTPSERTAEKAEQVLHEEVGKLNLEFNTKHFKQYVLGATKVGYESVDFFRFLGLEFWKSGRIRLSSEKCHKICNLFRFAFKRIGKRASPETKIERLINRAQRVVGGGIRNVAILDYYLKHTNDESQWRQIDLWLAEEVLATAYRTGHKRGNFRFCSFEKLREMGLPCLRHRHRLIRHGHINTSFFVLKEQQMFERYFK